MGCNLWSKEVWETEFNKNMVIVCTADVLLACLMHSFITMRQINLLIFDEAHHAKENHPYARIIKDFYISEVETSRPRIFGMTASPVDVDTVEEVRQRAIELETLLHARICTASDFKLLQAAVKRPKENVSLYERLSPPFETPLYTRLKEKYANVSDFDKLFAHAKEITRELGAWCSDVYWTFGFSERQAKKYSTKAQARQGKLRGQRAEKSMEKLDEEIECLKQAAASLSCHDFGIPRPVRDMVSIKVIRLFHVLDREFERSGDSRVLVFVERRHTAKLLAEVFRHIGTEYLRPGSLIGSNSQAQDGMHSSFRDQAVTLLKFRKGELNCLFATSVAEEGLDIQDCNVVIRFDPCKTMIQYIQSRGRARQTNSKFIHLVEEQNLAEKAKLAEVVRASRIMAEFCQTLPEDRLLDGWDDKRDVQIVKERASRTYQESPTTAKLTYDFALLVLHHFVSCVPHDPDDDMTINYVVSLCSGKFICEVILPDKCPIGNVTSKPCARKAIAKCAAAFDACIQLRKGQYLDPNFLPIYVKHLPEMRNARLGLSDKRPNRYEYIHKPALWAQGRGEVTDTFYLSVISLTQEWDRPVDPIGLVTRNPLPRLPTFSIYRNSGEPCDVQIQPLKAKLVLSSAQLDRLDRFTRRMWQDIYNKTFIPSPTDMSWWVAPLRDLSRVCDSSVPEQIIDWEMASHVDPGVETRWSPHMPASGFLNKFLVDPWNGGRRLYTHEIEPALKPSDPVPKGSAPTQKATNILDYSVSLWKRSRERNQHWDQTQPVVRSTLLHHRLNILATPQPQDVQAVTLAYVCPEPMLISPISVKTISMLVLFPAILHRIESYLIAMEFFEHLDIAVAPALALEAVTKDSDNQDDHHTTEKINFQRGMGPNYERLEFIGDCFLKTATSIALFVRFDKDNEYEMHVNRMVMVCNQNLRNTAIREEYFKFVRGHAFSRRTWYPEKLTLDPGKKQKAVGLRPDDANYRMQLGDKTVADICEAAIGAALVARFQSGHQAVSRFDDAVRAVGIFVANENFPMRKWQDFVDAYQLPAYQTEAASAAMRDLARKLESEHNYTFRYPRLAQSAFSHASLPRSWRAGVPDYQRLEFLGDSLLDLATITHLYYHHPDKDPGWLTEHKMAMVCNKFLGALSVKMGFHRHVRHNSPVLESQIREFVTDMEELERESAGMRNYWVTAKEPPKCLPDVVEAYVGAIFIDSGFEYAVVQGFFDAHVRWFFEDMSIYDTFASNHPINRLQTFLNEKMGCVNWRIMTREVPTTDNLGSNAIAGLVVHETVVADKAEASIAAAVRNAKAKAASRALQLMEGLAPYEFRERYRCDCVRKK